MRYRQLKVFLAKALLVVASIVIALVIIDIVSWTMVPTWPYRALRSAVIDDPEVQLNSWGMLDIDHEVEPPAGKERVILVGDSFLDNGNWGLMQVAYYARQALNEKHPIDLVNLGVTNTNPVDYYQRVIDVALPLHPDRLYVFLYAGNDLDDLSAYPPQHRSLVAKLRTVYFWQSSAKKLFPGLSYIIGARWPLIRNLWHHDVISLSAAKQDISRLNERILADDVDGFIDQYLKYGYTAAPDKQTIKLVFLSQWQKLRKALQDTLPFEGRREIMRRWVVDQVLGWEIGDWKVPTTLDEALENTKREAVAGTLYWMRKIRDVANDNNVPVTFILIPTGYHDPDYRAFWIPGWSRTFSWNLSSEARLIRLQEALDEDGIGYIDLRKLFAGHSGTYVRLDGHWTAKGTQMVGELLATELAPGRNDP
jgi:hypothetical protein